MPLIGENACYMVPHQGQIEFVSLANPGNIIPIIYTIPANSCYFFSTLHVAAFTNATVANRYLRLQIETDSGRTIWRWRNNIAQTASLDLYYTFNRKNENLNNFHNDALYCGPLPEIWLLAGTVITIDMQGWVTTDRIYGCRLTFAVYNIT